MRVNNEYPQEIAICTRQLSKSYRHRIVLDQIDLEIPAGQCVGLIGANGAGKTTLLRCLAALVRPTRGELRWFGKSVHGEYARSATWWASWPTSIVSILN